MTSFAKDISYGIRNLLRHPTFTVVAALTLALGIGANTAIFSVVNAILLRALPFQNPQQLVSVGKSASAEGLPGIGAYEYLAWKERNHSFEDLAAYTDNNFNLIGKGEPERIACAQVTETLFTTLGVQPLRGRVFLPEEDRPGQNPVVVVSEAFWQRRYGRDDALIGSSLTLDNKNYTVVGVMPSNFRYPGNFEIWMPLALDPVRENTGDMISLVEVVGRLKANTTADAAQSELNLLSRQAAAQRKDSFSPSTLEIVPLQQQLVAGVRRTVLVLWGAVALVMLLACANVANLMLARTLSRQREMAVRAAVGARRWQLVRQLLTESVTLGLAGGMLGILVAFWSTRAISALVPKGFTSSVHDLNAIGLDWRVFGFTFALALLTGVVFGLAPALTASKPDLVKSLRAGTGASLMSFGLRSLRGWLVVAELALALVLLLGAGLLVKSFRNLNAIELGFDRENVLTARISLPRSVYPNDQQTVGFNQQLLERVKTLPGVLSAGTINHTPLSGFGIIVFTGIEDHPKIDRKQENPLGVGSVSPGYFQTMKIPVLSGRVYDARDTAESPKVAIVNQSFVRRYYPNTQPLGKRLGFGCDEKEGLCRTIVGVVGNVRQESLRDDVTPEIYLPNTQMPMNGMTLFVRTQSDPMSLARAVRNEVLAIDRNQPLYDVKSLDERVSETMAVSRSLMLLFTGFAFLSMLLASIGIYGLVSYSVSQRTRDIGIRLALGAQAADVMRLILKNGIALTLSGVVVGLAGAFALTRFLATLLFAVTPTDTLTFVTVSLVLIVVAIVASLIPARRATKVDPLVALRYE
jgi:putative ABC transport system permease protein